MSERNNHRRQPRSPKSALGRSCPLTAIPLLAFAYCYLQAVATVIRLGKGLVKLV